MACAVIWNVSIQGDRSYYYNGIALWGPVVRVTLTQRKSLISLTIAKAFS